MSRFENEQKADEIKLLSGRPLGSNRLEYRGLYVKGTCIAVYIYVKEESDEQLDWPPRSDGPEVQTES